mgnify:FL=1
MFQKYRKLRGSLTSCFLRILRRWIGRTSRSSCGRVGSRQPAIRTLGLEYLLPSTETIGCVHSRVVLVSSAGLLSVRRRVRAGNPEARQLTGWRRETKCSRVLVSSRALVSTVRRVVVGPISRQERGSAVGWWSGRRRHRSSGARNGVDAGKLTTSFHRCQTTAGQSSGWSFWVTVQWVSNAERQSGRPSATSTHPYESSPDDWFWEDWLPVLDPELLPAR